MVENRQRILQAKFDRGRFDAEGALGRGEDAVKCFADRGYRVWGTMRDIAGRNAAKKAALEAHAPGISIIEMDVAEDDSVAAGFARIQSEGHIDILINNAGIMYLGLT